MAVGDDLDTTDDGILDDGPERVSRRRLGRRPRRRRQGTPRTATRCSPAATTEPVAPGGASRIPDGVDTDAPADWVRNDFDLAGIPGSTALVDGEAVNTPGAENTTTPVTDPGGDTGCDAPVVTIGSVQGSGAASPAAGTTVEIEGVVTGDFQVGGFDGYMQDSATATRRPPTASSSTPRAAPRSPSATRCT